MDETPTPRQPRQPLVVAYHGAARLWAASFSPHRVQRSSHPRPSGDPALGTCSGLEQYPAIINDAMKAMTALPSRLPTQSRIPHPAPRGPDAATGGPAICLGALHGDARRRAGGAPGSP